MKNKKKEKKKRGKRRSALHLCRLVSVSLSTRMIAKKSELLTSSDSCSIHTLTYHPEIAVY